MLGNFLEISISSQDLLSDLGAFEDLGFQALQVNETWTHQYGVMSDGALHFGLHNKEFDAPRLTFVLPDLEHNIRPLQNTGIDFDFARTSDNEFHEAGFTDASGLGVWLLEARTYSAALLDYAKSSVLGAFQHLLIPARNDNHRAWDALSLDEHGLSGTRLKLAEDCERLTVVYKTDVDALIVRGAREGWINFSVTQNHEGLIRTPHGFDFLIRDELQDD